MMLTTAIVRKPSEFVALRPEWNQLLHQSNQDSPFLWHQRLNTWWDVFGAEKELLILTCRAEDGHLVGVLPAYIHEIGSHVRARAVGFMGDRDVGASGLTAFANVGTERVVFTRLIETLLGLHEEWDVLEFNLVDAEGPFFEALNTTARTRVIPRSGVAQRIKLPHDWESYKRSLTQRQRKTLNHMMNVSRREGEEVETICSAADIEGALRDFWRLHEARMSMKFGPEFRVQPQYRVFAERMAFRLFEDDRLKLSFLTKAGRRIGVLYQFSYGNSMYGEKSGFDRSATPTLKPLIAHSMREAIEVGFEYFDLMLGEESYKLDWGVNEVRPFAQVKVYDRGVRGQLRHAHDVVAEQEYRKREVRERELALQTT